MDTQSNAQKEAQQVIEEMRAKRAALGDTTNTKVKLHYKRVTRPTLSRFILSAYIFVCGMLTSAVLMGYNTAIIPLVIIGIVALYSYLKE